MAARIWETKTVNEAVKALAEAGYRVDNLKDMVTVYGTEKRPVFTALRKCSGGPWICRIENDLFEGVN